MPYTFILQYNIWYIIIYIIYYIRYIAYNNCSLDTRWCSIRYRLYQNPANITRRLRAVVLTSLRFTRLRKRNTIYICITLSHITYITYNITSIIYINPWTVYETKFSPIGSATTWHFRENFIKRVCSKLTLSGKLSRIGAVPRNWHVRENVTILTICEVFSFSAGKFSRKC